MRLRIIEILYKLTFHLLRENGLGGLWDGDGSLDLLPSLIVIKHLLEISSIPNIGLMNFYN